MTFDFTPEQQLLIATAREVAELPAKALDTVLVLEERASHDPADAARFGFEGVGGRSNNTSAPLAGLEGSESALASVPDTNRLRARLVAAAVALGVGKAAVAHAIASMKKSGVKPGPDETAPHWTFADGATDVAAARLLTYNAAQMLDRNEDAASAVTRAHAFAARAAQHAVDAAIKVEGAAGYLKGGLLERLSRDARTLQVILR
jgi:hypothetical protein